MDGRTNPSFGIGMKRGLLLIASICLLPLAGCDSSPHRGDIPAQPFANALVALQGGSGDLRGRILFPSEFAQHSIRFSLGGVTFVTHPDGRFHVTRIPAGDHLLRVRIKGYEPVARPVRIAEGGNLQLHAISMVQARGRVLGRLVNRKGGSVSGVEVHLHPEGGVTVTDKEGIFQFLGVSAGDHTLRVKDKNYFAGNQHFSVKANHRRNLGNITVYRQSRSNAPTARLGN